MDMEIWEGIRNLINVSNKATTNISKIVENLKETTNPVEIAVALNTFYVNIGKSIEQKLSNVKAPFSSYLHNQTIYNIVLNPCTHDEVSKYISAICSVAESIGPNSISTSKILSTNRPNNVHIKFIIR